MPNYCEYFHLQFWGRQFSPELTHSQNGFIIRRKKGSDIQQLTKEMRCIFKDCTFEKMSKQNKKKREQHDVKVSTRVTPYQGIDWKIENEDPGHNQVESKIAITNNLRTLSKDVIQLFYGQKPDNKSEKEQHLFYGFDMAKNDHESNRENFKEFLKHNYKQYFYCIDRQENKLMQERATDRLEELFESKNVADYVSWQDWKRLAEEVFGLRGQKYDFQESTKLWRDHLKYFKFKQVNYEKAKEFKDKQDKQEFNDELNNIDDKTKDQYETIYVEGPYLEGEAIKKKLLIDRLIEQITKSDSYYMDMKLVVLEVPYQFPTGFFMQELSHIHEKTISYARFKNLNEDAEDVKNKGILQISKEINKVREDFKNAMDHCVDHKERSLKVDKKSNEFSKYYELAQNLYSEIQPWFVSDISGGASVWLYKFFQH